VQVKLLRALQEREITPVGDAKPQKVDVRIVSATHRDLGTLVAEHKFRADLFYRLEVVPVTMPPLRERMEDVPLLVKYFLDSLNRRTGRAVTVAPDALSAMRRHGWPGNVRELSNMIQRLHVLAQGDVIRVDDLPDKLRGAAAGDGGGDPAAPELPLSGLDLAATLAEIERRLIDDALARTGGNKARAAALLGMNRTTLVEKLKRRTT
jgi:DNA-binding NtrC family response regulator